MSPDIYWRVDLRILAKIKLVALIESRQTSLTCLTRTLLCPGGGSEGTGDNGSRG